MRNVLLRLFGRFQARRTLKALRATGAHVEDPVTFNGRCRVYVAGKVSIGQGFVCNSGRFAIDGGTDCLLAVGPGASLSIGSGSGISSTVIQCYNRVEIGAHVNIGAGCLIMDTDFHSLDYRDRRDRQLDFSRAGTKPVVVGDDVFVGARSIIAKGVSIGARSVIAAGSVVVKDIPSDCLAGGNPARVIKSLV